MKTCKNCGGQQFNADGKCSACVRRRAKEWYESNRARSLEYKRNYYAANKDRLNALTRAKRAAEPEKMQQYERARKRDPEKQKQYKAKYRSLNRDKLRAYEKRRREEHRDKVNASKTRWRVSHPEQCRVHVQNRHARTKYNGGALSTGIAARLMNLQKGLCAACRCSLEDTGYHLDHIIPLARGGRHDDQNVQLLCPSCNQKKGTKHHVEFMQQFGYLI